MNINESAKTVASVIAILLIPVAVVVFGYLQNRPKAPSLNLGAPELRADVLNPEINVIPDEENLNPENNNEGLNIGGIPNTDTTSDTYTDTSTDTASSAERVEISINGVKTLPNTSSKVE